VAAMGNAWFLRPAILVLLSAVGVLLFVLQLPDRFGPRADVAPLGADPTHVREDLVFAIQIRLALRGFDPGPIDGAFGSRTITAIQAFHAWAGASGGNDVSGELLRALDQWP